MNINRLNYESYFADYLDGQLNSHEVQELRTFLLQNNDLAELLEEMDFIKLKPPVVRYTHKDRLKKDEITALPDYYLIAISEHALPEKERRITTHDPKLTEDLALYQALKLVSDQTIRYKHKKQLYRPNRKLILLSLSGAAILLLFIGISQLYFFSYSPSPTIAWQIAEAEIIPPMELIAPQSPPAIEKKQRIIAETIHTTLQPSIARIKPMDQLFHLQKKNIELPPQDYTLKLPVRNDRFSAEPEIWLAKEAGEWRPSERTYLNDNLVVSVIEVGKIIGRRIKDSTSNK